MVCKICDHLLCFECLICHTAGHSFVKYSDHLEIQYKENFSRSEWARIAAQFSNVTTQSQIAFKNLNDFFCEVKRFQESYDRFSKEVFPKQYE